MRALAVAALLGAAGVAFGGEPVVVLLNASDAAQGVAIDGLPAGTWTGSFTSEPRKAYGRRMRDMVVADAGRLALDLPPRSVTTLASPGD